MLTVIFPIVIVVSSLLSTETTPIENEVRCTLSKLGCSCLNIETINAESVESCCKSELRTLLITGFDVKNISINITGSLCSKNFENLMIRDTGIVSFYFPFYGLDNLVNIYIEKNQNLSNLNKLYFSEISKKIKTISVENNIVRSIAARTFSNLTNLIDLKLSDNKIGYIDDHSFANLINLNVLYLNNNILTVLTADLFAGLDKLKILGLVNNFLIELKPDAFKYLKNLQFLRLSSDPNNELPGILNLPDRVFFSVKKLKSLNITLKIKNLTSLTFYGLNDLERLDLQGNQLTVIPSGALQQVPRIVGINLSRNQIRCLLPDTFKSLPRLRSLDLSNNDLSYIPNEVFADLTVLQTLELSDNNIYVLEKNAFVGLKSLLIFKMNVIHGKAKNELQNNFRKSSLAKLRNTTKILGFQEYYGIYNGLSEGPEISTTTDATKQNSTDLERSKNQCLVAAQSDKDWVDTTQSGSRKYLLIIVGICVVFLLIAFAIIMSYRAWSKRKMNDLSFNVDSHEKQEMLMNKCPTINGRVENNPNSKSYQTRTSLNGCYIAEISPDIVDKTEESSYITNQTDHSNIEVSIKPMSCPIPKENQSDDESALTPLGVL